MLAQLELMVQLRKLCLALQGSYKYGVSFGSLVEWKRREERPQDLEFHALSVGSYLVMDIH